MAGEMFESSFLQQSLYRAAKDGRSAVNVGMVLELHGRLDLHRLMTAVNRLTSWHEALRTTLTSANGRVHQVIASSVRVPTIVLDLSEEQAPDAAATQLIRDHLRRPFDLHGPLLWRVLIAKCAPGRHYLALSLHHALADGWSVGIITADLRALYEDADTAQPTEPALQFADYAAWEQQVAETVPLHGWEGRLRSHPARIRIPGGVAPGPEQLTVTRELANNEPGLSAAVHGLARRLRVPVVAVLAAATAASLHEHAEAGLTIGVVRGNRERTELREIVGYVADIAPVPVDLRGDPGFGDLVDRAARSLAYGQDHPAPLAALAHLVRGEREHGPLFDVCLNYLPGSPAAAPVGGLEFLGVDIPETEAVNQRWWDGTALIDYVVRSGEPEQLTGCVRGDVNTIPSELLADLAERFHATLIHGAARPDLPISELAAVTLGAAL